MQDPNAQGGQVPEPQAAPQVPPNPPLEAQPNPAQQPTQPDFSQSQPVPQAPPVQPPQQPSAFPSEPVATPTPESSPSPAPTPAPAAAPEAQPNPFFTSQPASTPQPPSETPVAPALTPVSQPKSKKPLIIILIIAVLLLIGGAVAAYFLLNKDISSVVAPTQVSESSNEEIAPDQKEAVTIANFTEFQQVCENKIVTNAAATEKPYEILPFLKTTNMWAAMALTDTSSDIASINVIACIDIDSSTEKLIQADCSVKNLSTQQDTTVDAYSATYNVTFYAPSTGEILAKDSVTPAAASCPTFVTTDDSKHYAVPLESDLRPVFDKFIAA
jgi:hypothetical protein